MLLLNGKSLKLYTEADFATILAKAAELSPASPRDSAAGSLSLVEMKSIAREAGLDPELIERAAHLVSGVSKPTLASRLCGGPLSAHVDLQVPVPLTQEGAQQLLSLVRATVLSHGDSEATGAGMSFSSFQGGQRIFLSAHPDGDGTRIRAVVDNRSQLVLPIAFTPLGILLVIAVAVGVGGEGPSDPATALPWAVLAVGIPTVAALAWRSVRKTVQRTLDTLDDLVGVLSIYARRK